MQASLVEIPQESPLILHHSVSQMPVHAGFPGFFSPHRSTGNIAGSCFGTSGAESGLIANR